MTVDAVGGVWQYAIGLAGHMATCGDSIVLAGLGPFPSQDQRRQAEQVATLVWLKTPPDWMATDATELQEMPNELAQLVRDHEIDLVHLNAPAQAAMLSLPCPVVAVSHSCVVTWFHVVHGTRPPEGWAWHEACNRAGFERADVVIAPSESHASALRTCYGPMPRLKVIHNAVPCLAAREKRRKIVFAAGRWWDTGKNGRVLDTAAFLSKWPVYCAGAAVGPDGLGISFSHAVWLGSVSNGEIRHLMAESGVFVSPSLYEPFGLAALEAAQAGTPLVLSDIPTYRELWGDAALFFPPNDADVLAKVINHLCSSQHARNSLGSAALHRSRLYTIARQAAAMSSAYDEAAAIYARRR